MKTIFFVAYDTPEAIKTFLGCASTLANAVTYCQSLNESSNLTIQPYIDEFIVDGFLAKLGGPMTPIASYDANGFLLP